MNFRPARILLLLTVLLTALVAVPPASAIDHGRGTPGYCPDASGVTVVVDFQELGGDVVIRCAPGGQESGLTALQNAGIEVTGAQRWGLGFVCRLEGKPGVESEPCIDTPPATAYWSYWHAPNAGEWTYSQYGVMNRKPPPGSFDGWSFSLNKNAETNPVPRIAPTRPGQQVAPPPPPAEQDGAIPGRDGVPREAVPTTTTEAAPPPSTPAPAKPQPEPSGAATPAPAEAPGQPPTSSVGGVAPGGITWTGGEALPGAAEPEFPWGALIGGVGALTLGGAAGFVAWRRKRATS